MPAPASRPPPVPEPAASQTHSTGPGVRKCRDDLVARTLDAWAQRRRISHGELAQVLTVSRTLVRRIRAQREQGGKPVHASDIFALPPRYRRELLVLLEAAFDEQGFDRAAGHD